MITILVPSYNHDKYIVECLAALAKIPVGDARIIMLDDGSTDHTVKKAREYLDSIANSNFEVIVKENGGLVSSLVLGLSICDTSYFYLVASDDIPNAEGILSCVTWLDNNPQAAFCIGGGKNFFDEEQGATTPVYRPKHEVFFNYSPDVRHEKLFLDYPSPILLQSTVFRTKALKEIGGWDQQLILDDLPTFIKLLTKYPKYGKDFIFLPDVEVVGYRQHRTNSYRNLQKQFLMVTQVYRKLAPANLMTKSIGNTLAYYTLAGLRRKEFTKVVAIWRGTSSAERYYSFLGMSKMMFWKLIGVSK